jgi:hypothetical protein
MNIIATFCVVLGLATVVLVVAAGNLFDGRNNGLDDLQWVLEPFKRQRMS